MVCSSRDGPSYFSHPLGPSQRPGKIDCLALGYNRYQLLIGKVKASSPCPLAFTPINCLVERGLDTHLIVCTYAGQAPVYTNNLMVNKIIIMAVKH